MSLKLLLLGGIVLLFFMFNMSELWSKRFFYFTMVMYLIRQLEIQPIGDITPAAYITIPLFFLAVGHDIHLIRKWSIFLVYISISLIIGWLGPEPERAFEWIFPLLVSMMLAVIPEYIIKSEADLNVYIKIILAVSAVFSITTIMGFLGIADGTVILAQDVDPENMHSSRVYGITNSNLIQMVTVASIAILPTAKLKFRWLEWAFIAITMFAVLVTLKRMTFIALLLSLGYYLYIQLRGGKKDTVVVVAILFIVLIPSFWHYLSYRFSIMGIGGGGELADHSAQSRIERISIAKTAFEQSPVWGKGAGYVTYVHNGLFEILGNCGLLGIFAILLSFFPRPKDIIAMNPWAVAIFIFSAIGLMLESTINHTQLMAFLGMFFGGYYVSRNLNIDYNTELQKCEETDSQS